MVPPFQTSFRPAGMVPAAPAPPAAPPAGLGMRRGLFAQSEESVEVGRLTGVGEMTVHRASVTAALVLSRYIATVIVTESPPPPPRLQGRVNPVVGRHLTGSTVPPAVDQPDRPFATRLLLRSLHPLPCTISPQESEVRPNRTMGGKLSKRQGVLFHWWPFYSKRNDRLKLF